MNDEGVWISEKEELVNMAKTYFQDCFKPDDNRRRARMIDQFNHVHHSLSMESMHALTEPFSELEVQAALFQMEPTKAPGPAGFSALFFQRCWRFLKTDVLKSITEMLNRGRVDAGYGDTLIILIPKVKRPKRMEEFRPISLCNVTGKIVTKVLANRLKLVLPEIISEFQSAFVPGRLITDNFLLAHEISHFLRTRKHQKSGFLSLKTDMSKAYDRVNWRFLELMMRNLGFPDKWIGLVMSCISSVVYRVKVNNRISEPFSPGRGLRQGDPLSPYLFLLCTEWLSRKIIEAQVSGSINGISISRGAPIISHLLFADDSIFFLKASRRNAINLRCILAEYQVVSGQMINLLKSEVVFSKNVAEDLMNDITEIFGVKRATTHSRYLGLPLVFGHNKSDLFKFIVERMWAKVLGWKEKKLSSAGKEVLIKSILQAIPNYVMMCFKIPGDLCRRIQSIILKFWWSKSDGDSSINWAKSSHLFRTKLNGGMNFRDMTLVNYALLAKQFWRLLNNGDSLVSKTLKAKYFPSTNILYSQLGNRPSYAWRSIWSAGMMIREWINIEPSVWTAEPNGFFTTRSAYLKLREKVEIEEANSRGECSSSISMRSLWKSVWKLNLQNKVKIFIWRLYYGFIPVACNLVRRGCSLEMHCRVCGFYKESTTHVFLECWWAKCFWNNLNLTCSFDSLSFSTIGDWIGYCSENMNPDELALTYYGAWIIWYNRNEIAHGKRGLTLPEAAIITREKVEYFRNPVHKLLITTEGRDLQWTAPRERWIKLNCDGAWLGSVKKAGFGCVVRNSENLILGVALGAEDNVKSSLEAEGKTLLHAMKWAKDNKWRECIFEIDCSAVADCIFKECGFAYHDRGWSFKCARLLLENTSWSISIVCREANSLADELAKKALNEDIRWKSTSAVPRYVSKMMHPAPVY